MVTAPIAITLSEEQLSRFTGYPVTLPVFEGPLDLLVYLIKRQELDIYDIPIAKITAQFLDYLALMEELDLEVASEFLVMAATLLEIKSRLLLPKPPAMLVEDEEDEEDPRAELVRQILEYQRFKGAAEELHRRAEERRRVFPRSMVVQNLPLMHQDPTLANPDAFSLWTALQEVLARVEAAEPAVREVTKPRQTIRGQILFILRMLETAPQGVAFSQLFFYEGREDTPTRFEVIVTFLALLELIRLRRILVQQPELFSEILISLAPQEVAA